jgi:hypothetical protein
VLDARERRVDHEEDNHDVIHGYHQHGVDGGEILRTPRCTRLAEDVVQGVPRHTP